MAMTIEQRISRLEGSYANLATEADIARLEGKLDALSNALFVRLGGLMIALAGIGVVVAKVWL